MPIIAIFTSMLLSGTIVAYILPKILLLSLKKKLIDPIDPRKIHKSTASRLGGVGFYPAIFIALSVCVALANSHYNTGVKLQTVIMVEAAALLMLYFIGLYDDIVGVKYRSKFVIQIITAIMLIDSGTYLNSLYLLDTTFVFPFWFSAPLTVLLIVFITNAINLIDGINGLASMLSIIALVVYGVIFFITDNYLYASISFTTVGALSPFWYHNVFGIRKRTKARIFMGDCGALVVGFILSIMAIKVWNISGERGECVTSNMCHILAYTVLLVPCMDVVRVVLRRMRNKKPLFLPDNNHIHHKFMALGFIPRNSLWIILSIQVFFIILNILLALVVNILYIFAIDIIVWTIMNMIITRKIKQKRLIQTN